MSTRKRPKSVIVYNKLLKMILEGNYIEGDKLPGEMELAEIVGVSRSTLRIAINLLCGDGILERRHGVGNFIKKFKPDEQDSLSILGNPVEKCYEGELTRMKSNHGIVSSKAYNPYFSYIFSKPSPVVVSSERFYYQKDDLKVYVDSLLSIDVLSDMDIDLDDHKEISDFLEGQIYEIANRVVYEWKLSRDNNFSSEIEIKDEEGIVVTLIEKVYDHKGEVIAYSKYLFSSKNFIARINVYNR